MQRPPWTISLDESCERQYYYLGGIPCNLEWACQDGATRLVLTLHNLKLFVETPLDESGERADNTTAWVGFTTSDGVGGIPRLVQGEVFPH